MTLLDQIDDEFIRAAHEQRKLSKVGRGKVGAVIVALGNDWSGDYHYPITYAHNGPRPGEPSCDELGCVSSIDSHRAGCPRKLHAEVRAIVDCARLGYRTSNTTLYCTHGPCNQCAQIIVRAGIKRFVYTTPYRLGDGYQYLITNGVETVQRGLRPDV